MSGLIPRPFIDDLIQRTDLVELIDGYVPLKKRGNSHLACCPFHSEKTPSFNVNAKKQFYHCFGCGASGNAISFVMNYLNQSFTDTIETLANRLGLTVPRDGNASGQVKNQNKDLYQILEEVNLFYQKCLTQEGQEALSYLKNRGLNSEIIKLYQLGYAPPGWHALQHSLKSRQRELLLTGMLIQTDDAKIYDRYRQRIMFPIHDRNGKIIGFGGRAISSEQKPKYLNSPETVIFQKSRELYGLYQVLSQHKTIDSIIIVEGYMDVIALAQHGIKNAVAALGTATSTYHIQLLAKHTKKLIFCFDGDNAGRQAAWRALENTIPHLNQGLEATFIFLPENHDPDSLVREEGQTAFLKRLDQATPLIRYFYDSLAKDINLASPSGRTQLINLAKPYLHKIPEGTFKEFLLDELSRLSRLDNHRLHQLLSDSQEDSKVTLKPKPYKITRTPLRIALALLLQHPELYKECKANLNLQLLNPQDHELLITILNQLETTPDTSTARLIESWRDTSYFDSVNKLSAWDHQVPEQELKKELLDTLLFLQKQGEESEIQQLMNKSRQEGLSANEKLKLLDLLKKRHILL